MENRNVILAIVLSLGILLGYDYFFVQPKRAIEAQRQAAISAQQTTPPSSPSSSSPAAIPGSGGAHLPGAQPEAPGTQTSASLAEVLSKSPRITISSPRLHGSIALRGARLDDLTLADYHEGLSPKTPEIMLLSPRGRKGAYFAEFGWTGNGVKVPTSDTLWTADRTTLTPQTPVTLTWNNGQGLLFSRTIALDENYMFTISQKVQNTSSAPVTLNSYGLISRWGTPKTTGYFILHEGPLGVFDGTLKEVKYKDLKKEPKMEQTTTGGWIGFTDKYWLAALVPDQKEKVDTRFVHRTDGGIDKYQTDYLGAPMTVAPGASISTQDRIFAGAKEVKLLDAYKEKLGIARFDLAIDFGWFYFLTKPIFYTMIWFNEHLGNFGLAILSLTVLIKLALFPLANKSYRAMSKMKKLQPEMKKLQERFKEDKNRLNQEMMALYKREKANPAAGCLPMVVQIPVFFALYKVLFVTIEMRHAPFYGWIHDLSAPDPTSVFNLFGLIPWSPPAFLLIGAWPLIMGVTMWLQQRLNPQPADPIQAKMFMFLPVVFTFMLAHFPAGLVIYWSWNNSLSILQQWVIMRRAEAKP